MQVYTRVCLEDYPMRDADGTEFTLMRAKAYTTSAVREADGTVMVFSRYWVRVPVSLFAGAQEFTPLGPASGAAIP